MWPRSGRQIADALSEYGSVDVEAGFRLLTEVSATTFDIHPYGSGSDPSKRKFPGILNVILDLVARCHHGKFGFYPSEFCFLQNVEFGFGMVENWVSPPGNLFPSKCGILRWDGLMKKFIGHPFFSGFVWAPWEKFAAGCLGTVSLSNLCLHVSNGLKTNANENESSNA